MLGKNREAEEAARRASAMSGVPYRPTTRFAPLDVDRATRIAREYDLMKHDPDDPLVKMAYDQMIKETNDQYEAMLQAGIEPYFIEPGNNPYRNSPYEALLDVAENRRIGVFPSVEGFGTDPNFNPQGNPLLQETGRLISGRPALANDLFRAVHDYFGHAKPGVGFRAAGEENAYQSHAGMYSPLARRALASETRGQNSYLNYGPYGETNRTAKIEDTRFADQKAGLMPRWASEAGLVINDDRRREFFDNLARNQTGLEGAISDDGKLRLIHYSTRPLERIDPEFYGRGLSRASLAERNRSYDPEFIKRSYYGIPASEKPYVPEFGLGGIRNEVLIEPELIYQAQANPEGLWIRNDPTGSERRIAEAGYTGYYSTDPKLGKVAVIFDPYDVSKSYMIPVGAVGAGAMAMSGEDDAEGMSKGGLVDKLRSAASSVKEAGNVYKAAVGNMFSPFEPVEPQLGDPNDYEFPELRLRRPGIVNLALGMPNMAADMRYLFGAVKDAAIGDEVPDEEWRKFDIASEAQGRYEEDMDSFLRSYTGKSMDELSGPMSAVLGLSEAAAQPGIISAKVVAGLPSLARYLSHLAEFATPVTVASPGAMLTGAGINAGIRALPALTDGDDLEQMNARYSGRELSGEEQDRLDDYLQELLGKKDGGLIDRFNQSFYENISKPAVGTAIDMTVGLGDLAQMAARYLGNKAGFDAGEFTSVAQPVKEAIGVDDYNPYTIGGVGASILPFAAAGRTAQAINAAPAGVRQIQAALPNLGRESAAYVGAEAAGAGAREFMPDSPMAELFANVAGGMGGSALGSQPTSMGIIKEKGGNWLAGSIEDELDVLHSANQGMREDTPARQLAELEEKFTPEGMALLAPQTREFVQQNIDQLRSRAQIDNWIDSKLTKYIRNEMATESDPIRLQADAFEGVRTERLAQKDAQIARAVENMERARLERGRTPEEMTASREQIRELQRERALIAAQTGLHINPDEVGINRYLAEDIRKGQGYPQLGASRTARAWEDASDVAVFPSTAGTHLTYSADSVLDDNPWLAKIPTESKTYELRQTGYTHNFRGLGFDHMMDELRNATRPDSDLPENLRIDPNYLSKMSVPQIVQRVDEINAYRATVEAEANERLANNAATRMFREYSAVPGTETPNQQELRWVELALPDAALPEGYRTVNSPDGLVRLIDKDGRELSAGATPEEAASLYNREERIKSLSDALKYEGDTLNHCVGGYCDKVVGGKSRIYSLRDALGQPYVTIETGKKPITYSDIVRVVGIDAADEMLEKGMTLRQMSSSIPEFQNLENILQIKGKRNAAPAEEYLPFVQDFVRSQDWNDVRDLENSGLYKADPYELGMYLPQDERLRNIAGRRTEDFIRAQQAGLFNNQKYLTRREWEDILRRQIESESGPLPDVEGFKKGGLVYDANRINALSAQLMEPVRLSEGGPPPRSKIARAAAAVRGAATPPREIPDEQRVSEDDFARIARDLGIDPYETSVLTDMPMPSITQYTAADRAAAGRRAASLIRSQDQMKASEALGRLMEQGFTKTSTTQADRTRVGGGNIGGPAFPVLGEVDPEYAGRSWGVMNQGTASRLMNLSSPETAWTTMLGSSDQLKSNPIVFDKLKKAFLSSMRQGNLSPELESKINQNLRLTFGEGANIRDPNIWNEADTFAKRAALADLLMGQGTAPAKGGVALGGEKSGRGVIFKPSEILMAETERGLLHPEHGGNVPTFALGPRLFTIGETAEYRPDLHPGFPTLLEGRDLGYNVIPTPTEVYLPDWHRRYKSLFPERKPGYYELTSGLPSEGLPSQDLTDDYIRHLIREGFSQGGLANYRDMIRSN
jgi:hypothetical protein